MRHEYRRDGKAERKPEQNCPYVGSHRVSLSWVPEASNPAMIAGFKGFPQGFGMARAPTGNQRKSFSRTGNSYPIMDFSLHCFQPLGNGSGGALPIADEVARNGALQRKNFGQRFSWAPLAFFSVGALSLRFAPSQLSAVIRRESAVPQGPGRFAATGWRPPAP
jgi:hypothetical protein